MSVTLHDVARAAGVSVSTASRALASSDLVASATRDRVNAIARELGYRPNRAASLLRAGRTATIGLLVPDLENPYFASLAKGVQARARDNEFAVLVADSDESPRREAGLLAQLAQQVDGLVIASPRGVNAGEVEELGRPAVLINARIDDLPWVGVDYEDAMMQSVQHLHALGHRRIAYVGGPRESRSDAIRRRGLDEVAGRFEDVEIVDLGSFPPQVEGGQAAADLAVSSGASAVIAFNDLVAAGLVEVLGSRGVDVPGRMSVIGCDDTIVARLATPHLTTIAVDTRHAGELAVDLLMERLDGAGDQPSGRHLRVPVHLVVRASTGTVPN